MNGSGKSGYGIAPVPLYRAEYFDDVTNTVQVDNYLTHPQSLARVGAIAVKTIKFAQCTAFLDYQSLNSTGILREYYQSTLGGELAENAEENIEMLYYIRQNIRSSFDAAFEDVIVRHYVAHGGSTYSSEKWHNLILANDFKLSRAEIVEIYGDVLARKRAALEALVISYANLP